MAAGVGADEFGSVDRRGWSTRRGHRARLHGDAGREAVRGRASFARSVNTRGPSAPPVKGPKRSGKTSLRAWAAREERGCWPGAAVELLAESCFCVGAADDLAWLFEVYEAVPLGASCGGADSEAGEQRAPETAPSTQVAAARPPTRWDLAQRVAEEGGRSQHFVGRWAALTERVFDGEARRRRASAAGPAVAAALARALRADLARPLWEQPGRGSGGGLRSLACRLAARAWPSCASGAARATGSQPIRVRLTIREPALHDAAAAAAQQVLQSNKHMLSPLSKFHARLHGADAPLRVRLAPPPPAHSRTAQESECLRVVRQFGTPIDAKSREFRIATNYFEKTLNYHGSVRFESLTRIRNDEVYAKCAPNAGSCETVMFHGCKTAMNEAIIIRDGFQVSKCRSGGENYGTWFVYNADYSNDGYVATDGCGVRRIFVCRVSCSQIKMHSTVMRVVG